MTPLSTPARRRAAGRAGAVEAALRAVGTARTPLDVPTLAAGVRATQRATLVAVTPRVVAEGRAAAGRRTATPTSGTTRTTAAALAAVAPVRSASTATGRGASPVVPRAARAALAAAAVLVLGTGAATLASRDALPGDALYGLKRTSESLGTALVTGGPDRGRSHLHHAQERVEEAMALVAQPAAAGLALPAAGPGPVYAAASAMSTSRAHEVADTLHDADAETRAGVAELGERAVAASDPALLAMVTTWAPGQRERIGGLVDRLPAGPAHTAAATSLAAIGTGLARAAAVSDELRHHLTCAHRDRDEFGPRPCDPAAGDPATDPAGPAAPGGPGGPAADAGRDGSGDPATSDPALPRAAPTDPSGPTGPAGVTLAAGTAAGTAPAAAPDGRADGRDTPTAGPGAPPAAGADDHGRSSDAPGHAAAPPAAGDTRPGATSTPAPAPPGREDPPGRSGGHPAPPSHPAPPAPTAGATGPAGDPGGDDPGCGHGHGAGHGGRGHGDGDGGCPPAGGGRPGH